MDLSTIGQIELSKGSPHTAVQYFSLALEQKKEPKKRAEILLKRAFCFQMMRLNSQCLTDCNEAVKLDPNNFLGYLLRGDLFIKSGNPKRAIDDFTAVIRLQPKNVDGYEKRGRAYMMIGKLSEALEDYTLAFSLTPNISLLVDKGIVLSKMRRFKEALEVFNHVLGFDPNYLDAILNRGTALLEMGEYTLALEAFSKCVKLNPKNHMYWLNRATTYFKMNKTELALDDFNTAIKINPMDPRIYFNRGTFFSETGDFQLAIQDFTKCIQIHPSYVAAWNNRGDCYKKMKKYNEAISDFTKALDLLPNHLSFVNRGQLFFEISEFEKAIQDFSSALSIRKEDYRSCFELGRCCVQLKMYEKAVHYFTETIRLCPEEPFEAHLNRASVYADLKRFDEALVDFQKAIDLNPKFPRSYFNRGTLFNELKKYREAIEDFTKAIRLDRNHWKAYLNRGNAYNESHQHELALEDLSKAITLKPDKAIAYANRGLAYYDLRKHELAMKDYNRSISLDSKNPISLSGRGTVLLELGKYEEAEADFSKALELRVDAEYLVGRGASRTEQKKFEEALEDYNKSFELNPKSYQLLNNRGRLFFNMKKYKLAEDDLVRSIDLNPNTGITLCNMGELMGAKKELSKSVSFFERAVSLQKGNKGLFNVYKWRFRALKDLNDPEFLLEDYAKIMRFASNRKDFDWEGEELKSCEEKLKRRMEDRCFPFLAKETDLQMKEAVREMEELRDVKEKMKSLKWKDMILYRSVGGGAFGMAYLCRIRGVHGVFVMKMIKLKTMRVKSSEETLLLLEKDNLNVGYHPNLVQILCHKTGEKVVVPDLVAKEEKMLSFGGTRKTVRYVLMKFYRQDLGKYVVLRRLENQPFATIEIALMLRGVLRGVRHLNENMIIHRDIHEGNIFVNPLYGNILIGDFGCCIDLRDSNQKGNLVVQKDNPLLLEGSSYYEYLNRNGRWCAPEIMYFDETTHGCLDLSKSDLFSVGMMGYYLVKSFQEGFDSKKQKVFPYGPVFGEVEEREGVSLSSLKSMFSYQDLVDKTLDPKLLDVIRGLLLIDPKERMGVDIALKILDTVLDSCRDQMLLGGKNKD